MGASAWRGTDRAREIDKLVVRAVRLLLAYVISPLIAAPVLFGTVFLLEGQSPWPALIAPLTFHGMMITFVAALAVLFAGTLLYFVSRSTAQFSRIWVWALVGACLGVLLGLPYLGFGATPVLLGGVLTGAASATLFRLIAGSPVSRDRSASTG